MEAVSCKVVTKQSNNSTSEGLKGVGNRFICQVFGLTESGGAQ